MRTRGQPIGDPVARLLSLGVDNFPGRFTRAATVTDVIDSEHISLSSATSSGADATDAATTPGGREATATRHPVDALTDLVTVLDRTADDLLSMAPFFGDQDTQSRADAFIDEAVAALRTCRADADDLRRALSAREGQH